MVAEVITTDDSRWLSALDRVQHDIYHLPAYVRFAAAHERGRAAALYVEEGEALLLAPIVLRDVPVELGSGAAELDAVSPYGYSGPVVTAGTDASTQRRLLDTAAEAAAAEGIVCGFFRMHPLLPLDSGALAGAGEVVVHGSTVYVDLRSGAEAARSGIRQGHRHDIKKLQRAEFTAHLDAWDDFDPFVEIYLATMERVAASDYYFFGDDYFDGLRRALGSALHLISVRDREGTVAAGGLFSAHEGIAQYLFSGTAETFLRQAPTKLMLADAITWAADAGCEVLHLGGGVGGAEDSLFGFKAGFSKNRSDFLSYRQTFDPAAYDRLSARWLETVGGPTDSAFFPLYRAPGTVATSAASAPSRSEPA